MGRRREGGSQEEMRERVHEVFHILNMYKLNDFVCNFVS